MIQISKLYKGYTNNDILKNISFTIHKKEKLGLLGRNGHGKTTLFRMLAGLESPDSGTILYPKGYRISYLKQEINFTHATILEEVLSGLPNNERTEIWHAEKILFGLDFTKEMIEQNPNTLSGGWMNRLNLAKVLISDADLLLLDEPTNHLDIITINWLTKFLQLWKKELILITHDRFFMDAIVTHTMLIHRRQIKKIPGTSQKIYDQIAQEEEIYEKTRMNDEKEKQQVELFIRKFRAKARLAGMVQSRIKSLEKKDNKEKLELISDLDFQFNFKSFESKNMMRIEDLSFGYDSENLLIKDLNFDINKDDRVAIIGKNGRGKSTLLKILSKKLLPLEGSVKTHPQLVCGYYGQIAEQELNPLLSIEEEIMNILPNRNRNLARSIAGAMLFEGSSALKKCGILSGGEKSRVLLGKLIGTPCHALFLDEPSNHLDMQSVDGLIEALDCFEGAVIFVTHNSMMLHTLANKCIVFDNDYPYLFLGTYQDFLDTKGFSDEKELCDNNTKKTSKIDKKNLKYSQNKEKLMRDSIKSLEKDIISLEKEISDIEKKQILIQKDLIKLAEKNEKDWIQTLSLELGKTGELIEKLYSILSEKYNKLDIIRKKEL